MRPRQHADRRGDKQEEGNKRHMGMHNETGRQVCHRAPVPAPPPRRAAEASPRRLGAREEDERRNSAKRNAAGRGAEGAIRRVSWF